MSISRLLRLLLLSALFASCSAATQVPRTGAGLAIYQPAQLMTGAEISKANLDEVRLEDQPVISSEEILSYSPQTRELRLAPAAIRRLTEMKIPVNGRAFVIRAGGRALLGGAFWTPISSLSFDGVTILLPLGQADAAAVQLDSGYPTRSFAGQEDPLSDPGFLKAFEDEGKLK